jgi:hypothetical protein
MISDVGYEEKTAKHGLLIVQVAGLPQGSRFMPSRKASGNGYI